MSNSLTKIAALFFFSQISIVAAAQIRGNYAAIYSGTPWVDQNGKTVSAHAANIIKDKGKYYLFGEAHTDTSNAFVGFNCYSSPDLYNWRFESMALPQQKSGKLGPNRVGERPKVLRCPKTGEYIMLMHCDTMGYTDQYIGYATANSITGPYTFHGPLLFKGAPIKKWDMGSFQDRDGSGYLLVHGGNIFKLSDDYKSVTEQVLKDLAPDCESPALFRKGNIYFQLMSNKTSWERNDNYYYTAASLKGPWTSRGLLAPKGMLTWNSQTTFVLPIEGTKDTTYMFMGDRWAYPRQASSATYVWQPLTISGTSLSMPKYLEAWQVDLKTGLVSAPVGTTKIIDHGDTKTIAYSGPWLKGTGAACSDMKGDYFRADFTGKQVAIYGVSRPDGGYARITIQNDQAKTVLTALIDMYSMYTVNSLNFISPVMSKGRYTLTVTVVGEHGNWTDKRKNLFGSKGNFVSLDKLVVQ